MTKKIVIGMSLCNDKCRSRALKVAVSVPGVQSAEVVRGDKDEVVVIGDVDPVKLTRKLRKKMGHAELLSVNAEKPPPAPVPVPVPVEGVVAPPPCYGVPQYYHHYEVREPACYSPCSIL